MKVLLIEDDSVIAENIKLLLSENNFIVDISPTGKSGIDNAVINEYDVILLDWMLPDVNGDMVCRNIRQKEVKTPIIFLTAKNQVEDKVTGLDIGADDYITKPFVIEELLARIRSVIRRNYNREHQAVINIGKVQIDTSKCSVKINNKSINLSPKEYSLLEFLALNTDRVISRTELIEHLWDENADLFSNVIDVHIKNLRQIFKKYRVKDIIHTIKGRGYMCSADSK